MSVPTRRTSRSPLRRRARSSAAVPGAPEADTSTVMGRRVRAPRLHATYDMRLPQGGSSQECKQVVAMGLEPGGACQDLVAASRIPHLAPAGAALDPAEPAVRLVSELVAVRDDLEQPDTGVVVQPISIAEEPQPLPPVDAAETPLHRLAVGTEG